VNADALAYQRFLGACRGFWAGPMFQALQRRAAGKEAAAIEADPTHQMFAWFERHVQRMRYSGRWGMAPMLEAEREALLARLDREHDPDVLVLDPALASPRYWLDHDFHQHPGGLGGDISAFVYREAVGQGGVVGQPGLHDRFARIALAGRAPAAILDLGCGFGRATLAFANAVENADVTGIDLSASCLKLAAVDLPNALHGRVHYRQADVTAPKLPAGSFDVVTSTMLLHELPEAALREVIAESARLLAPGGIAVHLDFLPPDDTLLRLLYEGHSRRNNEPFMRDLAALDLQAVHREAGFERVEITPFAEADCVLDGPPSRWRLPWTMITATKPLTGMST